MYERHFGLSQPPFSIAPDPRYLYMSERHREALAHLLYGVRGGGGFVVLTGDIGAGKTTVCRCFLEQIPERCNVAYVFNPKLTVEELLKTICDEFRAGYRHEGPGVPTVKDYVDALNDHLLRTHAAGQDNVLIIDEAQNLSAEVLEQLRLLTNLETSERKLLQIVLIGQPELRAMLARPELEQLSQRVIARYHLDALGEHETAEYVRHRLAVAGLTRSLPFDARAMRRIWRWSRGVPRRINLLCDRALLGAYAKGDSNAGTSVIDQAAAEVLGPSGDASASGVRWRGIAIAASALAAVAVAVAIVLVSGRTGTPGAGEATAPPTAPASASASASASGRSAPAPSAGDPAPAVPQSDAQPAEKKAEAQVDVVPPVALADAAVPAAAAKPGSQEAPAAAAGSAAEPFDLPRGFTSLVGPAREPMRALAGEWSVALGEGDPCAEAARQQLRCFERGDSTLALIRQLDRPVVLKLRDSRSRTAHALLVGLSERVAILSIDGKPREVALMSLADFWRGEFATFWRVPPAARDAGPGHPARTDPQWLARRLAITRGVPMPEGGVDESTLREWIYAFQLSQGLRADGVAGPVTVMLLNRASGVAEPRLRKAT